MRNIQKTLEINREVYLRVIRAIREAEKDKESCLKNLSCSEITGALQYTINRIEEEIPLKF